MSTSEPKAKKQKLNNANMSLIKDLSAAFRAAANAERAAGQKKYLRNQFEFLGLSSPERRGLQKPILKSHPIRSNDELVATVRELWNLEEREYSYAGMEILTSHASLWTADTLSVFKDLITRDSWWDTVDCLSTSGVGPLVKKFPELKPKMSEWIVDENMWVRRCAILHQLKYKKQTDAQLLFNFCTLTMSESDFFIRKAIGWALREYSKTSAEAVQNFIKENKDNLSPLSVREGSKYI